MAKGFKTGGRPKGGLNKRTLEIKAALEEAFARLGGVDFLVRWGEEDPAGFATVWSKLLPRDININQTVNLAEAVREARLRMLA